MFLAWNEIKRNKLKFGLIIGILVLISYLLFSLSGLANGLINMNTEGIKKWKADAIVLNKDANQTVQQSIFKTSKSNDKFKVGDKIKLSQSDEKLRIVGVSESAKYNASPVIFTNNKTMQKINPTLTIDKTNAIVVRDKHWKDKKSRQRS